MQDAHTTDGRMSISYAVFHTHMSTAWKVVLASLSVRLALLHTSHWFFQYRFGETTRQSATVVVLRIGRSWCFVVLMFFVWSVKSGI